VDQGRVWNGAPVPGEILSDLHHGAGMGARVGLGENLLVALDLGRSREANAAIYLGLGYLF
jgi:outer membrane translocation and assembly module TamA